MPKVKVWNLNTHPYQETFKGDLIKIEAGGFVEMEYDEAIQFKGTFKPPVKDADGNDQPEGYKMIKVDPPGGAAVVPVVTEHVCTLCKEKFQTEKSLILHASSEHKDQIHVDEAIEAEIQQKRKPGRPPGSATKQAS